MKPDGPESAAPAGEAGAGPPRAVLRAPVDVRSTSLGVLAVLGCVYTLQWASAVFIPVLTGLMLSYALSPIVNQMQRWRIPRALGASVLLIAILVSAWSGAASIWRWVSRRA